MGTPREPLTRRGATAFLSVRWRFVILRMSRPHGMAEPEQQPETNRPSWRYGATPCIGEHMADQAHDWTDEQIERLQRKFRREYNAAAREMRSKLDDWMKEYDEAKRDWQAKVRKGEAKQEDFDGWLSDMAHDHDFIAGMAEKLARDAVRTDKLAMDYVNDAIPEVYAENANFAAWSVERQLGYDTHAFDLYDQDTVRRMIAEGDIAEGLVLPKPKVDARKDRPWNQRKFTSALKIGRASCRERV